MGDDGAAGLLEMRKAGAMAQDEDSGVVFGMPEAAVERGAAVKTIALAQIHAETVRPWAAPLTSVA